MTAGRRATRATGALPLALIGARLIELLAAPDPSEPTIARQAAW